MKIEMKPLAAFWRSVPRDKPEVLLLQKDLKDRDVGDRFLVKMSKRKPFGSTNFIVLQIIRCAFEIDESVIRTSVFKDSDALQ